MKQRERMPAGEHERLLGALLRIPYQALTVRIQQGLTAAGYAELHPSHMAVLQQIRPEGSRLSEIVETAQMTKQAINYLVDHLEAQGYIERIPDPDDRRARIVRLTRLGWELDRQARAIIKESTQEWARQLGTEQMQQLEQILRDLAALIESGH